MDRSAIAPLIVALVLVGAACSGDGGPETTQAQPVTTTAPVATTSPSATSSTAATTTTTLDPTRDAPPGFVRHVDVEGGFVVDVPEDWVAIGTDPELIDELLAEGGAVAGVDPQLVELAATQLDAGVALVLFDPEGSGANINLIDAASGTGLTAGVYARLAPGFMAEFGATDIETEVVELPAGDAVRATFATPSLGTHGIQYSIFTGGGLWVMTLNAEDVAPYAALLDHMAGSFDTG